KVLIKENLSEGNYQVEFNGDKLSSGVYFYALKTSKYQNVKKMLLLK
ncbi:MAG: peptidase S8, partial [Ignavibacteriae bacterium]